MNDVKVEPQRTRESFLFWTHGIAIVGMAINVIALGLVLVSLRYAMETISCGVDLSMASWSTDLDKVFIEHPCMRPYFYEGKTIDPNDENYNRALSIAEMTIDTMDSVLESEEHLRSGFPHKGWKNWITDSFAKSPITRTRMETYKRWVEGSRLLKFYTKWKSENPQFYERTKAPK